MSVKYIFCISTGRCGTDYLSRLFSTLTCSSVYHEQKPLLHNDIMRSYLEGDVGKLEVQLPEKLRRIQECQNDLYVDTSHIFIKSFGWELPKYLPESDIGVVVLKRQRNQVVKSTQRIHSGPFTYLGRKWVIVPYKKAVLAPPISPLRYTFYRGMFKLYEAFKRERHQVVKHYPRFIQKLSEQLLGWYYDETYALAEVFKKRYPNIRYVDVALEDLNNVQGFESIIEAFELEAFYDRSKVLPYLGHMTNQKLEYKC